MSMRQRINHIPLPDLIVDVVDHTLALDWRQLFSRFFAEEKKKFVVGTFWNDPRNERRAPTQSCTAPVITLDEIDDGLIVHL